jgi:hypothetical protein
MHIQNRLFEAIYQSRFHQKSPSQNVTSNRPKNWQLPSLLASLSMGTIRERLSSRTPKRAVKIQKLIGCELFKQNPLLDYVPTTNETIQDRVSFKSGYKLG